MQGFHYMLCISDDAYSGFAVPSVWEPQEMYPDDKCTLLGFKV